jgi:hypothetical protein
LLDPQLFFFFILYNFGYITMLIKLFLFVSSFFLSSSHALTPQDVCASQVCVGVVDVGSTGSRLHVYTYKDKAHPSRDIREIWTKHVTPGFASLPLNHADTDAYLEQVFLGAPVHIPVYFYATAGMRLLENEKQKEYHDIVKDWFSTSAWNLQEARTITGREEGVFAWLSVYYALALSSDKGIQKDSLMNKVGILDTGGASVQIVTSVSSMNSTHSDDFIPIKLESGTVTLFAHSFLGLGRNLVIQQFLNDPMCYSDNYVLPNILLGKGDALVCAQHVARLINGVHSVNEIIQPVLNSEPQKDWYVMGGLLYLAKSSYIDAHDSITSTYLLNQANKTVCQQDWPKVEHDYQNQYDLFRACFVSSYYYALLTQGYGLAPEETIHFLPKNAVSDWTAGVVLHQD